MVFFLAFIFLIMVNLISILSNDAAFMTAMRVLSVPVFFACFFMTYSLKNTPLLFFLVFIFLGENANILFHDFSIVCTESIFYCVAFIQLIVFILPYFKFRELDKIIKGYLLLMLCLGLFFLKALIDVIGFGVLDKAEILLFSAKNIAVIILGFIAYGVYFQVQNKPSIFFLIAVVSISFSCIIDYLILSSSNHWVYSVLSRMTYLSGLYFIFQYIINKSSSKDYKSSEHINKSFLSDTVLGLNNY